MSVVVVGLSHRSAPVAVLEKAASALGPSSTVLEQLARAPHVDEVVLIATCNRLEVYAEVATFHGGVYDISTVLTEVSGLGVDQLTDHLYVRHDDHAIAHLFSVAGGLDSMAVGEPQVLGQVRSALRQAEQSGTLAGDLRALFQQCLRVGKRIQSETALASVNPSLVDAGLERAADARGDLSDAKVLVIGAGTMSGLVLSTVQRYGVGALTIANRSREAAVALASTYEADVVDLTNAAEMETALREADVVFGCTGAQGYVLSAHQVNETGNPERPKVFIDLALPRDFDPVLGQIPGIALYGLEELGQSLAAGHDGTEIERARALVAAEVAQYLAGRRAAEVVPTVVALRSHADELTRSELQRLRERLGANADERVVAEVEYTVKRVVDKLLHTPTVKVKTLTSQTRSVTSYAAALRELFDLDTGAANKVSDVLRAMPGDADEMTPVTPAPAGGAQK